VAPEEHGRDVAMGTAQIQKTLKAWMVLGRRWRAFDLYLIVTGFRSGDLDRGEQSAVLTSEMDGTSGQKRLFVGGRAVMMLKLNQG